jgi:CRISPR-associated protein Cmr1
MMQDFRVRGAPDYVHVKEHMRGRAKHDRSKRLRSAPERVTFGLPLAFQFSELPRERETFVPFSKDALERGEPLERHPSLLFLRLVEIGASYHPALIRLDGPIPGIDPPAAFRNAREALARPADGPRTMDAFLRYLTGGGER